MATNTGYFLATLDIIEDLHLTYDATMSQILSALEAYEFASEKTNNDYCNVITQDSVGNTLFMRFKWNGKEDTFKYEFALNNSSFTAVQWEAINSNATAENIAQIALNALAITALQSDVAGKVAKTGDTMTGRLLNNQSIALSDWKGEDARYHWGFRQDSTQMAIRRWNADFSDSTFVLNFNTSNNAFFRGTIFNKNQSTYELVNSNEAQQLIDSTVANYLPLAGGTMTGDVKFVKQEEVSIEFEAGNAVKWRMWKPTTSGSIYFQIKSGNSWSTRMQISSTGEVRIMGPVYNNNQIINPLVNSEEVKSICLPLTGGEITGDVTFQGQPNTQQYIKFFKDNTSLNCFAIRNPYGGGQIDIGLYRRSTGAYVEGIRLSYRASATKVTLNIIGGLLYGGDTNDENTRYQMRSDIYKQGVVSQTQTWTQASDLSYSYVMSNQVTGNIPIYFIELVEELGATFNETSGYFELNGLTDISYKEMKAIYRQTNRLVSTHNWDSAIFYYKDVRTNFGRMNTVINTGGSGSTMNQYYLGDMLRGSNVEVLSLSPKYNGVNSKSTVLFTYIKDIYELASSCYYLKKIVGTIYIYNSLAQSFFADVFYHAYSLEEFYIMKLYRNLSFEHSSKLKFDCVQFLVDNANNGTTAITITLHPTTYATCQADTTEYTYSGQTYTGIISYAAARNITIQSA